MNTVWFSLRRRLLSLLLGGVAVAWLVTMVFSYLDAHHEVDELFDAQLAQAGQTLLAIASHEAHEGNDGGEIDDFGEAMHKYQRRLRFQIWRPDGSLLMRSNNAPEEPITAADGFSETRNEQGRWRHFSQWNDERSLQVQVSESHHVRDELIGQIAWRLLLPALFGLPIIGLWVWLVTRKGFASLDGMARQIASRDPQQLQAVTPATAPEEIKPLLDALNGLFQRVEHTLDQLQSGLTRASHLVDQMLQLARLDPESGLPDPQPVDLGLLAESVCADIGPQILARNLDFDLAAAPACIVTGQADWLRVLIRNLVDNAVRYTPERGMVRVSVSRDASGCRLTVSDNGPGIPPEARELVLRRFHRLDQGKQPGSGLGLAIVARIAELHRADFQLDRSDITKGLIVAVQFPVR